MWIEPWLGPRQALQIAFPTACVWFFWLLFSQYAGSASPGRAQLLAVGVLWVGLTLGFEIGLGRLQGYSWQRILREYDIRQDGLMVYGMLLILFAPLIAQLSRSSSLSQVHESTRTGNRPLLAPRAADRYRVPA